MKAAKNLTGSPMPAQTLFNANTVLILAFSACYWAWFDAVIFRPTLFMPFTNSSEFYSLYFMAAIASSALVLLAAAIMKNRFPHPFNTMTSIIAILTTVLAGSALTIVGAMSLNSVLIFIGALPTGASCSLFLLGWARTYSQNGARSACFYISGAIALGVFIDMLISGLSPMFAAVFSAILPAIFIWFPLLAQSSSESHKSHGSTAVDNTKRAGIAISPTGLSSENEIYTHDPASEQARTLTLESIFESSHFHFFKFSFSLMISFFIFGFSFGFMQFNTAFTSPELYPFSSDALLISRGVSSLLIFLAILFFPKQIYNVFRIGILIGIGGFIAVPFLSTLANYSLITGFVIAIGYTTFDIITWTLLSELSYTSGEDTRVTFGPGRFVVHVSILIGFLIALLLSANTHTAELEEAFFTTIGYFLVVAEMLLLSENSALWMLIRSNASDHESGSLTHADELSVRSSQSLAQVIDGYGLTDREAEILRYLIVGRSRPRIAQILSISENTVSSHIQHIYQKLDVHGLQELLDRFS